MAKATLPEPSTPSSLLQAVFTHLILCLHYDKRITHDCVPKFEKYDQPQSFTS